LGHPRAQGDCRKPNALDGLNAYVEKAMTRWEVPGLAIAVVKGGELILVRGYGVRALGDAAPVDAETLFSLASCTKAFASAAIARLVDAGELQWDDTIARHLPAFQLSNPELTSTVTIRHALAHRTGLPTANMLWRSGAFGSQEIVEKLRWLRPVAAPGEKFVYNNNMYLVVGQVVERVSRQKWGDFLRNELFTPLGMQSTVVESSELRGLNNVAAPHATDAGKLKRIERHCPDVIAPAGAIHSNVLDMARWLLLHLEAGRSGGKQVLSAARMAEMHTAPQPVAAQAQTDPKLPRAPISNYGLGWFFNDYAGRRVVEHSGTQTGFVSWVAMIPQERLGLVILANHHRTGLNFAVRSWLFDALLGRPERDWSEAIRADYTNGYQRLLREAKTEFERKRFPAAPSPRPLSEYAGTYESKLYGRLGINVETELLRIRFGTRFVGGLEHWQQDAFRATFANPRLDDWLVTFTIQNQEVVGLHIKESPWAPPWYDDADDLGDFRRI
jgi:CubicO group peptidase (beta-lactamase class C family)